MSGEVGGVFRNTAFILVLFILLVIILASGCFGIY
ncbi:dihydroorotate dehydrogenase [Paenibacillus sp. KQZ6P-2]|uniref:Dihydroorotate dehydrogenase n=1 Tax=Paenibacillus mangrovi TaxID=2931978 RepID=A0A9X1WWL8_9BACL|nr:dihydroorotate dehydrogenase [Paenibacillus mangrovi]MCJ8014893.1 dihydroorotate dehydrogenase [Paenibacillus mangrovi]